MKNVVKYIFSKNLRLIIRDCVRASDKNCLRAIFFFPFVYIQHTVLLS